jgi:predicted permease
VGGPGTRDWAEDLVYAGRRLLATPLQVAVTVLSLGVGIGLTTSVFAVANAFLLQSPAGLTDTEGLVAVFTSDERGRLYDASSYPDVRDVERSAEIFQGLTAIRPGVVRWVDDESSRRVIVEIVDGNYFDVLGVALPLGRAFAPEETVVGRAQPVAVISYQVWQERFGGLPSVLGTPLRLDGRDFTIIGVAPEGLLGRFLRLKVDAWVPIGLPGGVYHSTPGELEDRSAREYLVYGRLRPGVSVEQAQARLDVLSARFLDEHPDEWSDDRESGRSLTVLPEKEARVPPDGRKALAGLSAFLLAGAVLILLIACVNVAGIFLARALRRRREIAVRLSLGAGRGRIVRLLLVEALLLALAGGALGVGFASFAARFLASIPFPMDVPLGFGVDVNGRVLLFALLTALGTCLACGLIPALRASRPDLVSVLKGGDSEGRGRHFGLRGALVVIQVAASLVLVVGAGLSLRSLVALASVEPGLSYEGIAVASWRERDSEADEDAARRKILSLAEELSASPQISEVAVASTAELSAWASANSALLRLEGGATAGREVVVTGNVVTPGYFELVGLRPARGRTLRATDAPGAAGVALVNESFVRAHWSGEEVLGRSFTILERRIFGKPYEYRSRTVEVVGVLPDVESVTGEPLGPYFWTSLLQDHSPLVVFHARGLRGAPDAAPELRRVVQASPDEVALVSAQSYADLVAFQTLGQRLALEGLGWSGGFTLLLALMGIYGIVSFAVGERTREMAIRQAVGADRGAVRRALVWDGLRLTGVGTALGLAVVIPLSILARSSLLGISPVDPAALLGGTSLLLLAAFVASAVPAWRAGRMDPMRVLSQD